MFTKLSFSKTKIYLILVFIVSGVLLLMPSFLLNKYYLKFDFWVIRLFLLVPWLNILIAVFSHKGGLSNLTVIKYWQFFPLVFYYDRGPSKCRFKKIDEIKPLLKPGDIILIRIDNYIDGIVLKQTSYFTHIGIYYGDNENASNCVIHEISDTGVDFLPIDQFARCDDIIVLRIKELYKGAVHPPFLIMANNFGLLEEGTGVFSNICHKTKKIMFYLQKEKTLNDQSNLYLKGQELTIYSNLVAKQYVPREDFIPVVLDVAKSVKSVGYDFNFDFQTFHRFSCVSFVWYCFKCLFPIHEVKVEPFYYFTIIKTCVIVPDSFVNSNGFDVIYCSINNTGTDQKKVIDYIKDKKLNFWKLLGRAVLGQLLILLLIKVVCIRLAS